MRIRTIKPEFFKDEDLAELPPVCRLLFTGLWCMADREGRLEDRPKLIKIEVLPYDNCNVDSLLQKLHDAGFILRYETHGKACIQVIEFLRHQIPFRDEPQSELPSPEGDVEHYQKPPNGTMRMRIYQRDGYLCSYCGLDMTDKVRARCLDHVVPYSKGGSNEDSNLVTSCKKCNAKKGARTPDEAGMTWPEGYGKTRDRIVVEHPVNTSSTVHNTPSTGSDKKGKGEQERSTGKVSDAPARVSDEDQDHKTNMRTITDLLCARFSIDGRPYMFQKTDGILVSRWLKFYKPETVAAMIDLFPEVIDPWTRKNKGLTARALQWDLQKVLDNPGIKAREAKFRAAWAVTPPTPLIVEMRPIPGPQDRQAEKVNAMQQAAALDA